LTIATKSSGLGHIMRCLAISDAIEHRGVKTDFIIKSNYNIDFINTYEKIDWINELSKIAPRLKEYSTVIVDSINISEDILSEIQNHIRKLVFIDDYYRWVHDNRLVIDWTVAGEKEGIHKRTDSSKYLLGTKYAALRSGFWTDNNRCNNKNVENILITFGGSDIHNLTPKIIGIIKEIIPEVTMNVVIGKGYKNIHKIELEANNQVNIIFYPDVVLMKKTMMICDIAIASGGQTLYELACVGLPAIAIILVDNQVDDTIGWESVGSLCNVGWWNANGFDQNIIEQLNNLMNFEIRKEMSELGQAHIDGLGAMRIADYIIGFNENCI